MEREPTDAGTARAMRPRQRALFTDALTPGEDVLAIEAVAASAQSVTETVSAAPLVAPQRTRGGDAMYPPVYAPARDAPDPTGRLYLTADLRAATGTPRTAMDFYLRAGVIRPTVRAESGYLLFDERELTILRHVLEWRARRISVREIKARLGR